MGDPYGYCANTAAPLTLRPFTPQDTALFARWLAAPHVARWYHDPEDWLREASDERFGWISRFIVESDGAAVGFCQYYEYRLGGERWHKNADTAGAYSIDYLIGEQTALGRGLGQQLVAVLTEKIRAIADAKRILVKPEKENAASCGVLRACGYRFDGENEIYVFDFDR